MTSFDELKIGQIYKIQDINIDDCFTARCYVKITSHYNNHYFGYIWKEDDPEEDEDDRKYIEIYEKYVGYEDDKGRQVYHDYKNIIPYIDDILRAMKNAASDDT
jgi:hypothetical protein